MSYDTQRPLYYLLADGGGTKTTIKLLDKSYNIIGDVRSTPGNIKTSPLGAWNSINSGLESILGPEIKLDSSSVTAILGMAGYESKKSREQFIENAPEYINQLYVYSDAAIACFGAHGGLDGTLVIVGTGIKGYQVEGDHHFDVAGWGFPHSDEGGGAWLGMEAIRHVFQVVDTRAEKSQLSQMILSDFDYDALKLLDSVIKATPFEFGQFARYVVQASLDGDQFATGLLKSASDEVVKVIQALKEKQKTSNLPLALAGGLSEYIITYLPEEVQKRLIIRKGNALDGAFYQLKKIQKN